MTSHGGKHKKRTLSEVLVGRNEHNNRSQTRYTLGPNGLRTKTQQLEVMDEQVQALLTEALFSTGSRGADGYKSPKRRQ
uniref:Transposase n=1 Tax=Steinernema glaseri TaxID=37863 RepID=A0A1I8AAJ2_9BILA